MFAHLLPLFATAAALFASGSAPRTDVVGTAAPAAASVRLEAAPAVTAQLYISYVGNGYWAVVVDGHSSAPNASVGVRVYGDDPWFDDFLFSIVGTARTDYAGNFNLARTVYRSTLDEDWEGTDEIYAIADVSGAGSVRTNTISRSF